MALIFMPNNFATSLPHEKKDIVSRNHTKTMSNKVIVKLDISIEEFILYKVS